MKRSSPLRRTPMKRGGTPLRRTPLRSKPSTKPKARRVKPDPVTAEVRAEVAARDGGCVMRRFLPEHRCAGRLDPHHRKLRGHGDHRAVNLVTLCRVAHSYVHEHVEWAYGNGLLVHGWDDVRPL